MNNILKKFAFPLLVLLGMSAAIAGVATGGANTGDFDVIVGILTDWTTGTLGQAVAISMVIVGLIAGIARQSLMALVIGVGGGMGLSYAPTVINNVFSAGIPLM